MPIKFSGLASLLLLLAFMVFAHGKEEIITAIDFAKANEVRTEKEKGMFSGVLPGGIIPDFPKWNESEVTATAMEDSGRKFLRLNVSKLDFMVQFCDNRQFIPVPGYYRVKVICRNAESKFNVYFRQKKQPYKTLWEHKIKAAAQWQELDLPVYIKENKNIDTSEIMLYMSLPLGITDIAEIQIIKSNVQENTSAICLSIKRISAGTANFLRSSRYPLGLQSGWSYDRENTKGRIEADAHNPGADGSPSLKIDSLEKITVFSELFQTDDPALPLQSSFSYKAKGKWQVRLGNKIINLLESAEWKIASLSCQPDGMEKGFYLVFSGIGTLNVDSCIVHSGDKLKPYQSAGDCEIALAPVKSDLSLTRLQFADTPAQIKYYVTGNAASAVLKGKVTNIYGAEKNLPEIDITKKSQGVIDYELFPEAKLGAFRIEVWAERNSQRISPINEIVLTRIRRPVYWGKDAPDSPFGSHFYSNQRVVTTMKAAGINWNRTNDSFMEATCWGWLEKEKCQWTFADEKIKSYRDAHIKLLGYIGTAPEWASYSTPDRAHPHDYMRRMSQPKDIEAYQNYVRTIITRYRGVIDEYQFQNEPWSSTFWHKGYDPVTKKLAPGSTPEKDYADLAKITYPLIKSIAPETVLYGINTSSSKPAWTKAMYDMHAYDYCDAVDYHKYNENTELSAFPGDAVEKSYNKAIGYIKENNKSTLKPVIMSEGNAYVGGVVPAENRTEYDFVGLLKNSIPWRSTDDNVEFADMLCRFVISHLSQGVKRIFLYSDHCYHNLLKPANFPVLLGSDGYPHPTLAAFSNMAWLLEDKKIAENFPLGDNVFVNIFSGKGESVAVITGRQNGKLEINLNDKLECLDLFGNPIKVKAPYAGRIIYIRANMNSQELLILIKQLLRS